MEVRLVDKYEISTIDHTLYNKRLRFQYFVGSSSLEPPKTQLLAAVAKSTNLECPVLVEGLHGWLQTTWYNISLEIKEMNLSSTFLMWIHSKHEQRPDPPTKLLDGMATIVRAEGEEDSPAQPVFLWRTKSKSSKATNPPNLELKWTK